MCGYRLLENYKNNLWASKKIKKPIKPRKTEKKSKKPNRKKKPIRIFKKPTGSVQFRFYKPETEKTEPNPNQKKTEPKPSQT